MVTLKDLSDNHLVLHNKQHHRKVLLSRFHLNGHRFWFHPDSKLRTIPPGLAFTCQEKKGLLGGYVMDCWTFLGFCHFIQKEKGLLGAMFWTFLCSGLEGESQSFWSLIIWRHSYLPIINIAEYPPTSPPLH